MNNANINSEWNDKQRVADRSFACCHLSVAPVIRNFVVNGGSNDENNFSINRNSDVILADMNFSVGSLASKLCLRKSGGLLTIKE